MKAPTAFAVGAFLWAAEGRKVVAAGFAGVNLGLGVVRRYGLDGFGQTFGLLGWH